MFKKNCKPADIGLSVLSITLKHNRVAILVTLALMKHSAGGWVIQHSGTSRQILKERTKILITSMKQFLNYDSSSIKRIFMMIEEIDQNIEEWISHFIDQIENNNT